MVCDYAAAGLSSGRRQCAYVSQFHRVGVAGKQYCSRTDFPGKEKWRGGVGASELECQVAWATGALRMDSAAGDHGGENEHAVSRPADGQGARTGGPDLRAEYWADAASESAGGARYPAMFAVAGAARL